MTSLVDGVPAQCIDVTDRGFQYGDGLFETIAYRDGGLEFWQRHMARLTQDCMRLGIEPPPADLLLQESLSLCREQPDGVIKITVTRGSGGRGYRPPQQAQSRRVVSFHPMPPSGSTPRHQAVVVRLCDLRLSAQPALAGMKHLNRLEQVMARREWFDDQISEGLMCNTEGELIEGTQSNLFIVSGAVLYTPQLSLR